MRSERLVEAPVIANAFERYKFLVTQKGKIPWDPANEFRLMQTYYAAFAEALNIAEGIWQATNPDELKNLVKAELDFFSKSNLELAEKLGREVTYLSSGDDYDAN